MKIIPIHVLVVDDEASLCTLTRHFLEMQGEMEVETVCSVKDAMAMLTAKRYDAIVSDYQMPGQDGIQFLKSLRASGNGTPFILFTGKGREEVVIEALNNGADAYLQKGGDPVSQYTELGHRILGLIQRSRAEKALRDSEERFKKMADSGDEWIWEVDENGLLVYSNQVVERIIGYEPEELIGKKYFYDLKPPEEREQIKERVFAAFRSKLPIHALVNNGMTKSGEIVILETNGIPIEDETGRLIGYRGTSKDITKLKLADKLMKESEEKYKNIFAAVNDATFLVDVETGSILDANSSACNMFGYSALEFSRLNILEISAEPDKTQEVIKEHQNWVPLRLEKKKDGTIFPVEISINNFVLKGRDVLIAVIRDVTTRRKAEEALQESGQCFKDLFENMNSGVAIYRVLNEGERGCDYQIRDFNRKALEIEGKTKEEVVGKSLYDLRPEIDGYGLIPIFRQVWKTGQPAFYPAKVYVDEHYYKWYENTVFRLSSGEIVAIYTDVTDRMRMTTELNENEKRYRTVVHSATEAIVVVQDDMLRLVNPMAVTMSGFSEQELLSKPMLSLIHPEDRAMVKERFHALIQGEVATGRYVFRLAAKDGSTRYIENGVILIEWEGRPATLNFLMDITERKRAEDALERVKKKLNLLSGITRHDINNQLMVLKGNLSLMEGERDGKASEAQLRMAENAAERISAIIQFTKEYEDIGVHAPKWQEVRALITEASKGISFEKVTLVNDVPAGMEVFADPLIVKVFHNLIHNAINHGRIINSIHFSVEEIDGSQTLVCEDDGIGIPEDGRGQLFTRNYGQEHGLGLFLSREILTITGIAISEAGRQGHGARFLMAIPPGGIRTAFG